MFIQLVILTIISIVGSQTVVKKECAKFSTQTECNSVAISCNWADGKCSHKPCSTRQTAVCYGAENVLQPNNCVFFNGGKCVDQKNFCHEYTSPTPMSALGCHGTWTKNDGICVLDITDSKKCKNYYTAAADGTLARACSTRTTQQACIAVSYSCQWANSKCIDLPCSSRQSNLCLGTCLVEDTTKCTVFNNKCVDVKNTCPEYTSTTDMTNASSCNMAWARNYGYCQLNPNNKKQCRI